MGGQILASKMEFSARNTSNTTKSTTNFLGSKLNSGFTLIQTRKAFDSEQRIIRQSAMPLRQRARHLRLVRCIWVMATGGLGSWIGMTTCCVSGSFAGEAKMQPMYLGEEIGRSSSWSCLVGDVFTDSIIVNHHHFGNILFWIFFQSSKFRSFPRKCCEDVVFWLWMIQS